MLAVDFFHVDCAIIILKRIYVFFTGCEAATFTSSERQATRPNPDHPAGPQPANGPRRPRRNLPGTRPHATDRTAPGCDSEITSPEPCRDDLSD
jgi:hypothetical protein